MFIERKEQRAASRLHDTIDITPSHLYIIVHCCRLELAVPPRTGVHTTRLRSHSKYPYIL